MTIEETKALSIQLHAMELRMTSRVVALETKLDLIGSVSKDIQLIKIFLAMLYVVVIGKVAGIPIGSWE